MIKILLENFYVQLLIIGLILTLVYLQLTKKRLNEPPIVYYRYPIFGHTFQFMTNCEKLIEESREKYGDAFTLYIFGKLMTVVRKDAIYDVYKKEGHDFNFQESPEVLLLTKYLFPYAAIDVNRSIKILRDFFKLKLANNTSKIHQTIIESMNEFVGECVEPKLIKSPNELLLNTYLRIAANLIVGEECASYVDILETFKDLFYSVYKSFFMPKLLSFIHPWLHDQVASFSLRFISNHRSKIINRIRPVIERRLLNKSKLGDSWDAPVDCLQLFLDDPEIAPDFNPNHVNYNMIVDTIGVFMFASMGITSNAAAYALVELAKRKKDYWQELYQEAQEINKKSNGKPTYKDFNNMVKVDMFIKESLRFNSNVLSVPRPCVRETYTFANGFQIPYGRPVFLDISEISFSEELNGQNPQEFDAHRHNSPATKPDNGFLIFGSGIRACPGRFFAILLAKIFLYHVLLNYNIKAELENAKHKQYAGFFIGLLKPGKAGIVFEKSA
ncbi:cytochrome P450 [Gigaspora rosea]|uniref:Cytochrome P450 n=1 Tax=Gigaspora rosea TaxID=44941 RepID=A0A397V6I1_9GLOM|nr:cytochrome P450 [Gigaspora rosea]